LVRLAAAEALRIAFVSLTSSALLYLYCIIFKLALNIAPDAADATTKIWMVDDVLKLI
jgi:hypothetical protein